MSDEEYGQEDFDQDNQQDDQEQQDNEDNNQEEKENEEEDQNNQNDEENQGNEEENQRDEDNNQQQENQSNVQLSNNQKSENQSQIEESEVEKSVQQVDVNLQSIDAVSVKITKDDKNSTKKSTKKNSKMSSQQQMVNDLMKKHKEKQKKMQQKEDEIYVQEKIQKQLPKPQNKPKVVTKQKLVFDKETKAKLEDPKLDNQQKAAILTKDLAKKLDKPIVVKDKPKQIEIKKPGIGSEAKPKVNLFDVRIGAGIPSKLDQDADEKASKDLAKERTAFLEQKKREKEQAIKYQEEQDALLKQKQDNLRKAQQKALDRENKVLLQNNEKQQEIKQVYEAKKQEKIKEKQEDDKDQLKKDLDILKALQRENALLVKELNEQEKEIQELTKTTELKSRHENVIQINGQYQSLRKVRMKEGIDGLATEMVNNQESQLIGGMSEEDQIALKVSNEIAKNDIKLNDAYALLDEDKDGALTIKELQNNISRLNLNLSEFEIEQFIKMIDSNSDGVLTEQEFVQFLTPSLENQKQYIKIMGDIKDILNPIVLEERRLHLKYLTKYLNKEIEEEKQKELDRKPEYNRLIKKLKKTEMLMEALKGTTSDKGKLKQQCEQLRQGLRLIQDKRNKITVDLREKKKMISENIEQLMQNLGIRSQQVIEAKEQLNKAQIQSQRVDIKLISLEQIREKYQKELQQKNEIEIRGGKTQAALQQLRFDMEKKTLKEKADEVKFLHYLIVVQKCTRGFLMKKKLQRKLKGLKGCANILFNFFQRKVKQSRLKGIYALEENLKTIKKLEEDRKKQEIINQQEMKKKFIKDKRKMQNYVTMQFTKINQPQQLTLLEEQLQILPKVITIQKVFRKRFNDIEITDKAVNIYFGLGNSDNCQICRTDIAEVICKVCDKPVLCDSCYRLNHKNYKKRNHGFFIIIKDSNSDQSSSNKNLNTIFNKLEQDEVLSN